MILISKNILRSVFFSFWTLLLTSLHASTNQSTGSSPELPRSAIFPPEDGNLLPLDGKILNGRYYAPQNVFSCQAEDFGSGKYIAQDGLLEQAACVGFYGPTGTSKKAEVMFLPGLEKKALDGKALKDAFDCFGIGILKTVDNAQGIEVLREEMIEGMFFASIFIEKMAVLKTHDEKYISSTRGYLIFQDKDKLIVLSNQTAILPGQKHTAKQHIEKLKQNILDFRKTFEFGSIPASCISIEKKEGETP